MRLPAVSGRRVLMFHVVPSREWFRDTLRTVGRFYRFVPLEEVEGWLEPGQGPQSRSLRGSCHVTFDDGDRTFLEHAVPVLEELGIPATLFVSPTLLAQGRRYWFQELDGLVQAVGEPRVRALVTQALGCAPGSLDPYTLPSVFKCLEHREMERVLEEVRQASGARVERLYNLDLDQLLALRDRRWLSLGAHTLDHPTLANETDAESLRQVRDSVVGLSDLLGRPVWSFAWPNGKPGLDFGPREMGFLSATGARLAFSTVTGSCGPGTDPLAIPRCGFTGTPRERGPWIVAKLALASAWEPTRDRLKPRTENRDRLRIRTLLPPPPGDGGPGRHA